MSLIIIYVSFSPELFLVRFVIYGVFIPATREIL